MTHGLYSRRWQIGLLAACALQFGGGESLAEDAADLDIYGQIQALTGAGRPCEAYHLATSQTERPNDVALVAELRTLCRTPDRANRRVLVAGGSWAVDEPDGERLTAVNDFYLDRFEVSVAEFRRCVRAGVCQSARFQDYASNRECNLGAPNRDRHPMNCVDWFSASTYCAWEGGRLPTESELEWAASDGGQFNFPWGWPMVTCERANHRRDNADGCGVGSTRPVGGHTDGASPSGVEELIGNVAEWVTDGYEEQLPAGRYIDPIFEGDTSRHAARGGSWRDSAGVLGSRLRAPYWASSQQPEIGFRCAADRGVDVAADRSAETTAPFNPREDSVIVIGGEFEMGSPRPVGDIDESPQRRITLSGFRLSRTEVTAAQYRSCVLEGGCRSLDFRRHDDDSAECNYGAVSRGQHPMNCVSWAGAQEFCHWAGGRLPTEAEWEVAARGIDTRTYPWGNESVDCSFASFNPDGRLPSAGCGVGGTVEVGRFPAGASAFQALDMAGNVQEWVSDWYDSIYYMIAPENDPTGPLAGSSRVVRGGSYADSDADLRSANRSFLDPGGTPSVVGFRCAWPQ